MVTLSNREDFQMLKRQEKKLKKQAKYPLWLPGKQSARTLELISELNLWLSLL